MALNDKQEKFAQSYILHRNASEAARAAMTANETKERLDNLFNAIQPLLTNLKANPEKEYILWPNRLEKVEQFEDYIQGIYNGKEKT